MTQYIITNPESIPENLDPGDYTTKVIEASFVEGELVVQLEYLGGVYTSDNPECLFPLTKEPDYVHPFVD